MNNKEYYQKNKEKLKKSFKIYYETHKKLKNPIWRLINCKECNKEFTRTYAYQKFCSQKCFLIHRKKDKQRHSKIYTSIWRKNNPHKVAQYERIKRLKNPIKVKARDYANHHNQRGSKCSECGITENLHFHHTNYERNEGITLCRKCHKKQHGGD